ncbi:carbohydrate binding domain-containing protein [Methanotorris formicicus]|uniref:carbohydrate binding domain-containing protein n=1 Tax=Methanotorris formicicus TaxID=213185 RepID=UPI001C1E4419|nr:carbohydrate binding domain-containing protein [Methanotorris formicicus]
MVIPENAPLYLDNYLKSTIGPGFYSWNMFLSTPMWGLEFLSFRFFFWIIGILLNLNVTQIVILERLLFQFFSFLGVFILLRYYLTEIMKNKNIKIVYLSSFIAGLFYSMNPSFWVGDSFWIGIQFSFTTLPWIIWSFSKVVLNKNWKYLIICALLMATNTDEHFLWAGFPIILLLYAWFIFLVKILKEKKIDIYTILSPFLIILIFILLNIHKLIIKPNNFSSYTYALTKEGLDICWMQATILNMLRAMSHMSLPNQYFIKSFLFNFLNSLMPITLIIPGMAFLSLIYYKKKRNWIILFYSILLILSILPFFVGSPFKWIHYWIFFNLPIGPAFRTWRISDAYIALSLSVLTAFSLYHILEKLYKKRKYIISIVISTILFVFCVYSWPLLTGDVNGLLSLVKVPNEYFETYSFLSNQLENFRVIYIPEFTYSYGRETNLKPFWSSKCGMIQEFLTFSSPKPTFWPNLHWSQYYEFTLSPYYHSLLTTGDTNTLSHFLGWVNIKYVVVHNDIPTIEKKITKCIQSLNNSTNFKLTFHDNFIYVFENKLAKGEIYAPSKLILVDGGYRAVKKFYNSILNDLDTYGFIFIDQKTSPELIKGTQIILTDKSKDQLMNDLAFVEILQKFSNYVIYPYNYVIEHKPKSKWSRVSFLDAENQIWHPYVNWKNYAWDFDYMKGAVLTINSNDKFTIPIKVENTNNYILLVRCLVSNNGGEIKVDVGNSSFKVETLGDYNGFLWKKINLGKLNRGEYNIAFKNVKGLNAINLLVLIPEDEYYKTKKEIEKLLQNKTIIIYIFEGEYDLYRHNAKIEKLPDASNGQVINFIKDGKAWQELEIIKAGTYRLALKGKEKFKINIGNKSFILNLNSTNFTYSPIFNLSKGNYVLEITPVLTNNNNLVKNPSFEIGAIKFWNWKTKKFNVELDNTTSYKGYYSLRVSTTTTTKSWSWIRSEPIDVKPNKKYLIITHMKIYNANASHIPIEGYVENKKQWKQLVQIPCGAVGTGTYDWREFSYILKIPENVTKIRVVLNAGWGFNKSKGEAVTWFDDIEIIPLDKAPKLDVIWLYSTKNNETIDQLFQVKEKPAEIINYTKINPTLWEVQVNATKPFMLSFAESYNPLWEARIYKDGKLIQKVSPVPLYGVINGFYINETGDLKIIIRYKPQDWFEIGLAISGITFLLCVTYLIYDWRREKGDKWVINLNKKLNNLLSKIKLT